MTATQLITHACRVLSQVDQALICSPLNLLQVVGSWLPAVTRPHISVTACHRLGVTPLDGFHTVLPP